MIFVAVGILVGPGLLGWSRTGFENHALLTVGEIALALLLFVDAVGVDPARIRTRLHLPGRLLGVGMPLTILLGFLGARLLLPGLSPAEAGILATVLAPTDAALGKPVVSHPRVPRPLRDGLNVEAGLNDGLSVPFLMVFLALSAAAADLRPGAYFLEVAARQIGLGALAGLAAGLAGGGLVGLCLRRGLASRHQVGLGMLALSMIAYALAGAMGGNGFIAAFVCGFGARITGRAAASHAVEFAESEGQVLNYVVFFVFGIACIPVLLAGVTGPVIAYALGSLTLFRMLPVALALLGTRLSAPVVLFTGWFGPRGLASIVLGLIVVAESPAVRDRAELRAAAVATILLSVILHGMTAAPFSERLGAYLEGASGDRGEDDVLNDPSRR
jgi:NhaP-type Na+/H+ or K+/H+ antiporter